MHVPRRSLYEKCLKKACPKCKAAVGEACVNSGSTADKQVVCSGRWARSVSTNSKSGRSMSF